MNIGKSIEELNKNLLNGNISASDLVNESIRKCKSIQNKTNSFVTILDEVKTNEQTDNILCNIPYGIKDNFSTKGVLSTGGSNTLRNYTPIFNATVVDKLNECGAVYVAKTSMDELGMGGTGTTGFNGLVHNPYDYDRQASGSSAGSAASVACGVYPFALGSDTGDSIRKPAAYCGIVGYKPTYGMVSRYGLFPFACSLDTVGVLTRNVKDSAIVIDAIKGKDNKDMTTWDSSDIKLSDVEIVKDKKLFYIKSLVDINNYNNPSEEFKLFIENYNKTIELCKKLNFTVEGVELDNKLLSALPSIYVILSCAEATSNMSNLTGISFGVREENDNATQMIKDFRTKNFSPLIKRRFVIGSYVLQKENQEKYFLNAKRVRRLIVNEMNSLFEKYDAMIMPVGVGVAKYLDNSKNNYDSSYSILDELLQIGNYGGYPSITIPNGIINNLPVGINITGKIKDDKNILDIAYTLESNMNYKDMIVEVNND